MRKKIIIYPNFQLSLYQTKTSPGDATVES